VASCFSCGTAFEPGDRFCANCGTPRRPDRNESVDASAEADEEPMKVPRKISGTRLLVGSVLGAAFWGVIIMVALDSDGCSSTEGTFEASGKPLGDFTFTPTHCRSGQHESFFGVYLLGKDGDAGGLKVVIDPRDGGAVMVEVPGSCRGADNDDCTVVPLEQDACATFDLDIEPTNTYVNDIRLLDGRLRLACTLPEGGSARADVRFSSCD
jgi:hypothetical protein